MKYKGLVISLSILSISSGICFSSTSFNKSQSVKAELDNKTIYVDISDIEGLNDQDIYLSYLDEDTPLTKVNDSIYQVDLPLSILLDTESSFEIVSDSYVSPLIIGGSLLSNEHYNYVRLLDDDIEYGCYSHNYYLDEHTYNNQRVWLYIDGNSQYNTLISYISNDEIHLAKSKISQIDSSIYRYFDVPYQISSLAFIQMDEYVIKHIYQIEYLQYGVCYSGDPSLTEVSPSIVDYANAPTLARVVEAFLTYGKDPSNGCVKETIRNVFNTWFANKNAGKSALKNEKILDYTGYAKNNNSYIGLEKNGEFSVNEKWHAMCAQAGIDPATGKDRSMFASFGSETKSLIIIGGVIVAFCAVGFICLKRKKRKACLD